LIHIYLIIGQTLLQLEHQKCIVQNQQVRLVWSLHWPQLHLRLVGSVDYIAPETGLSSGNPNNWISDNAEAVLLAACLYEASAFLKAGETLALYKTQFDEAVQLLIQEMQRDYAAEYNGGI
jgi:hypothetical protein